MANTYSEEVDKLCTEFCCADVDCTFIEYVLVEMKCGCNDPYHFNFDIE